MAKKVKISADTVLTILKGIMDDEEINETITDTTAPQEWQSKTVQEALNVEYYTFKHRPVDTELLVAELIKQGKEVDDFEELKRAFCILSLGSTERVFSKDNDIVTVSANLEYWIQTEKVKLLEDMFEDIAVESCGIRVPVKIGTEDRQVLIALGTLGISEIQETTEFGEMSVCDIDIDLVFYPKAVSKADYTAEFAVADDDGNINWVELPFSSLSIPANMTQKSLPYLNRTTDTSSLNLSRVKTFVFTFDGYDNEFINHITANTLADDLAEEDETLADIDNNEKIILRLTRDDKVYYYNCVIKSHTITVQEDGKNESHSLTLTTGR